MFSSYSCGYDIDNKTQIRLHKCMTSMPMWWLGHKFFNICKLRKEEQASQGKRNSHHHVWYEHKKGREAS